MSQVTNQQSLGNGIATATLMSWVGFGIWSAFYMGDLIETLKVTCN